MIKIKTTGIAAVRNEFLLKQNNVCPICENTITDPVLDHNHKTGIIRDVLCRNCNSLEGRILNTSRRCGVISIDLPNVLRNLAQYLDKHSSDQTGLIHPTYLTPQEKLIKTRRKRRKTHK